MSPWTKAITEDEAALRYLIGARAFLERGWCREAQARDADGAEVPPTDERAAWCPLGALRAAGMPIPEYGTHRALIRLGETLPLHYRDTIGWFNDQQTTVEPVLAAFDQAIANLKARAR
jgi:hypothetical protein